MKAHVNEIGGHVFEVRKQPRGVGYAEREVVAPEERDERRIVKARMANFERIAERQSLPSGDVGRPDMRASCARRACPPPRSSAARARRSARGAGHRSACSAEAARGSAPCTVLFTQALAEDDFGRNDLGRRPEHGGRRGGLYRTRSLPNRDRCIFPTPANEIRGAFREFLSG